MFLWWEGSMGCTWEPVCWSCANPLDSQNPGCLLKHGLSSHELQPVVGQAQCLEMLVSIKEFFLCPFGLSWASPTLKLKSP
jgi:hypothetical protein